MILFENMNEKLLKPYDPKENEEKTGFLPIERAWIDKVEKNNFLDVFRKFYPNKTDAYTYWDIKSRARDRNVGWRLDYFFADSKLFLDALKQREGGLRIKTTGILDDYYGSDHCPIYLELD